MENKLSEQDWDLLFFENELCRAFWFIGASSTDIDPIIDI
jgi:hypothetical protein